MIFAFSIKSKEKKLNNSVNDNNMRSVLQKSYTKKFCKFTGKPLWWSPFKFYKIFRSSFFKKTSEQLLLSRLNYKNITETSLTLQQYFDCHIWKKKCNNVLVPLWFILQVLYCQGCPTASRWIALRNSMSILHNSKIKEFELNFS